MRDEKFREAARMITMLAFVPLSSLEDVVDDLYVYFANNFKELRKVLWFAEGIYLGKSVEHAGEYLRRAARFNPLMWNHHQNVLDDLPITNNAKEGTAKLIYTHNSESLD